MISKEKHLELIGRAIDRLAQESAKARNWCITIAAGLSGLAIGQGRPSVFFAIGAATLLFWWLDASFLRQERAYREMHATVCATAGSESDGSMMAPPSESYLSVMARPTIAVFYGSVFCAAIGVGLYETLVK